MSVDGAGRETCTTLFIYMGEKLGVGGKKVAKSLLFLDFF
jgi:hypothetical protein